MGWRTDWGSARGVARRVNVPPTIYLGDVGGDFYAQINAQANAQISAGSQEATSWIQTNTGVDVQSQTNEQGAAAIAQLSTHGFDPTSAGDRQSMIAAIALGLNLIPPPAGQILSGALLTLYEIAQPLACPVASFFHTIGISQSDCSSPPCAHQGPATQPSDIINLTPGSPFMGVPGSFANLMWGALAINAASAMNCKSAIPPDAIVDGVVNAWNSVHAGPAADFYIPPLTSSWDGGVPIIPTWNSVQNNVTGSVDPNVYYAFAPMSLTYFGDLANAPAPPPMGGWIVHPLSPARTVSVNNGPLVGGTMRPPLHVINLHVGSGITTSDAPTTTSTAVKVAAGTAAGLSIGAIIAATVASYVIGKPVTKVLDIAWEKIKKAF